MLIKERVSRSIIDLVLALNALGLCYFIFHLQRYGYLPEPFIYDKSDTFMDLFNVMYWAYNDGRYTDWKSVYPPVNFIFIKIVNFLVNDSGGGDAFALRENGGAFIFLMSALYLAIPLAIMSFKEWDIFKRGDKTKLYISIVCSSPLLFALERGNLIILAPIFLAMALAYRGGGRAASIAILINIKPYFALLLAVYLVKTDFIGFVRCAFFSGLLFIVSGLLLDPNFLNFFKNLFAFSGATDIFSLREVMSLPSSVSAFSYVLNDPSVEFLTSGYSWAPLGGLFALMIELLKALVITYCIYTMATNARTISHEQTFFLLIVFISNMGVSVGGYTYILYIAFIPTILKMKSATSLLLILLLIFLPLDLLGVYSQDIGSQYVFFTHEWTDVRWNLSMGSVLRPLLNLCMLFTASWEVSRISKDILYSPRIAVSKTD